MFAVRTKHQTIADAGVAFTFGAINHQERFSAQLREIKKALAVRTEDQRSIAKSIVRFAFNSIEDDDPFIVSPGGVGGVLAVGTEDDRPFIEIFVLALLTPVDHGAPAALDVCG